VISYCQSNFQTTFQFRQLKFRPGHIITLTWLKHPPASKEWFIYAQITIGTRDIAPLDAFQLLKVGQVGGNVDCLVEHEIEAEDLMVDDIIVEIVPENVQVDPAVYDLLYVDLPLSVFECEGSLWADRPMGNGDVGEKFLNVLY